MLQSKILDSFWTADLFGSGYALADFWWWTDLIVLGVALVLVALYVIFVWVLGRMKMTDEDKAAYEEFKQSNNEEKKEKLKETTGPLKTVMRWNRMRLWLIPVTSVLLVISLVGVPVLSSTWDVLMTTISGSSVTIYDTESSREAAKEAETNVVSIEEEGIVMLKNEHNSLPLDIEDPQGKRVNIFGSCAYGLFYGNGGSGSFQTDGRVKSFPRVAKKLEIALQEEGFEINNNLYNMIKNYYASNRQTISVAESDYDIQCGFNKYNYGEIVPSKAPYDFEPPASVYERTDIAGMNGKSLLEDAKEFSDTAIFCITRRGSEDEDMNLGDFRLKANEAATIALLEDNFENVIILLNIPTVMESEFIEDNEIDSALWIGHPGLTGTTAVAEVLSGKVNPSGHLVDTWPYDVTSAQSYQNFGNDTTLRYTGAANNQSFTNYQEGIYVGYRYYVTRAMVDPENFDYDEYVQFSFGYGLSYTQFEKSIIDYKVDSTKQEIEISVEVKNIGNVAGKDVIQIYTHAPYYQGGIEKSWYTLTSFAKTSMLEPGETKNYKLTFTYRDLASWSTAKGYYVMEHGDYEFSLREDVWHLAKAAQGKTNTRSLSIASDIEFKTSYQTNKAYENIFQDVEWGGGAEKIEYLSRADFAGTFKLTSQIDRTSDASKFPGGTTNNTNGTEFDSKLPDNQITDPAPLTGQDNGLILSDLRDADWDDPKWELLLDQLTVNDMTTLVDQGSFKTAAVSRIGKIATTDYDGPGAAFHSGTGHPSEVIVAASWNHQIGRLMGESIGREGAARGLTGWYAPGINTHRSPFGGRNFEYYSEDPLIAGIMAGETAQGALKYGVYTYAKHFLLNEQERARAGVFVWATEQSIREIYARGFEIYCDMGGLGIMSSFNCIGSYWTGGSKALLTTLLREEWGFHGVVVTDYVSGGWMACNIGLRAQNDLWLNRSSYSASTVMQRTPNDGLHLIRRAAKNILYACAHSNCVWELEDYQAVGIDEIIRTNS